MKKCLFIASFCFATMGIFAQAPLEKGGLQLNAGVGTSSWSTPVYAGIDYGIVDDITIGAQVSYQSYKQDYFVDSFKSTILGIQANGNYHFNTLLEIPSKWDVYAGLSINYYNWSTDSKYENLVDGSSTGIGGQVGARYFFNDKFAVNLEFGGGSATSGGKLGITYKL